MSRRLRVLVVAPWIPPAKPMHAGGQAVRRHLEELARHYAVVLVAPLTRTAELDVPTGVEVVPVAQRPSNGAASHLRDYLAWLSNGVGWSAPAMRAAREALASGRLAGSLGRVDLVEAQYLESLPVAASIAAELSVPLVVWCHDVVTLELRRQTRHARSVRRKLEGLARLPGALRVERRLLRRCAGAVVFNPQDEAALRRHGLVGPLRVIRPAIEEGDGASRAGTEQRVLCVAAFARPANREGLDWFLQRSWPRIRREVPDATLRLVGSDAPATRTPGVVSIGFVEDLGAEYRAARLAIAPLLTGAGLKFKVPQAFSWRVPVVATTVAAEGLAAPPRTGFAAVVDDPERFAVAVVELLRDEATASTIGEAGHDWWSRRRAELSADSEICQWYADVVGDT